MMMRCWQAVPAVFFAVVCYATSAGAASHGGLQASPVEVRATVPGMTASGGYLVIMNHGAVAERLIDVSAAFADRSEIHEMLNVEGVMKMRQRPQGIEIPAHQMVALEPGGLHLMFMGLKQTLNPGDAFEVMLTFESGHILTVPAEVKRPGDIGDANPHASMKHSHAHDHMKTGHDHSDHAN